MKHKFLITSVRENYKLKKNIQRIYIGNWCLQNQTEYNPKVFDWDLNNNFKLNYNYLSKTIEKYKILLSKDSISFLKTGLENAILQSVHKAPAPGILFPIIFESSDPANIPYAIGALKPNFFAISLFL